MLWYFGSKYRLVNDGLFCNFLWLIKVDIEGSKLCAKVKMYILIQKNIKYTSIFLCGKKIF